MINKNITIQIPSRVSNDLESFNFLLETLNIILNSRNMDIHFDFGNTSWFDANLTAILGIIFELGSKNKNKLYIKNVHKNIQIIFRKNHFYATYALGEDIDTFDSTIKYTIFDSDNKPEFTKYIRNELIPKIRVKMSKGFTQAFRIAVEELFQNARTHGKCKNIFTCGQYFHLKSKVKFTVIDLGNTMLENVQEFLKKDNILADHAINWATIEGHSTRLSGETGGIGIPLIRDFLLKNEGKIQIISSNGYWEENKGIKHQCCMKHIFPGTIVNIEVNINDNNIYITTDEAYKYNITIENIF